MSKSVASFVILASSSWPAWLTLFYDDEKSMVDEFAKLGIDADYL